MQSDPTRVISSNSIGETAAVLLVFTKTPVPGRVKTRLIPVTGAVQAAAIHTDLLRQTLATARSSSVRNIELWCTPTVQHRSLIDLKEEFSLSMRAQAGADLGERMYFAMEQALENYRRVVLIGSDCIDLTAADIDLALKKLAEGYDVVLGPSLDGGYHLIGLTRLYRQLFTDIPWGTDEVMQKTRERVTRMELKLYELPERRDLDRPEDLHYIHDRVVN